VDEAEADGEAAGEDVGETRTPVEAAPVKPSVGEGVGVEAPVIGASHEEKASVGVALDDAAAEPDALEPDALEAVPFVAGVLNAGEESVEDGERMPRRPGSKPELDGVEEAAAAGETAGEEAAAGETAGDETAADEGVAAVDVVPAVPGPVSPPSRLPSPSRSPPVVELGAAAGLELVTTPPGPKVMPDPEAEGEEDGLLPSLEGAVVGVGWTIVAGVPPVEPTPGMMSVRKPSGSVLSFVVFTDATAVAMVFDPTTVVSEIITVVTPSLLAAAPDPVPVEPGEVSSLKRSDRLSRLVECELRSSEVGRTAGVVIVELVYSTRLM
jgi:hypothetical protein